MPQPAATPTAALTTCFIELLRAVRSNGGASFGPSFGSDEVDPFRVLNRDEHVVAVLVGLLRIVSERAYPFDDVELARALAEEDARRLPRPGQDLRCEDLQVVVQDIGLGQMNALDHPHV